MRLKAALSLALILCMTAVCVTPTALAQNADTAQGSGLAAAQAAFRRGEIAYNTGNYEAAVREWNNAYSVDPRPRIQFNLSQAYERMGQIENAIGALKRFVESADPEDPNYAGANARLGALQQRLAETGVIVQGGAEGGSILVDGQDWGRTPRPDKITVKPGNHLVTVRWASGQEYRANVYVPPGQVIEITVGDPSPGSATAAQDPAATKTTDEDIAPPPPAHSKKRWIWYGAGMGATAVGVGLIGYGISRFVAKGKCGERDDAMRVLYCDPDGEDAANTQGIAGVAVGGALLAGGAALIVIGAVKGRHDDARQARTSCGLGFASARCTLRF